MALIDRSRQILNKYRVIELSTTPYSLLDTDSGSLIINPITASGIQAILLPQATIDLIGVFFCFRNLSSGGYDFDVSTYNTSDFINLATSVGVESGKTFRSNEAASLCITCCSTNNWWVDYMTADWSIIT